MKENVVTNSKLPLIQAFDFGTLVNLCGMEILDSKQRFTLRSIIESIHK